MGRLYEVTLRGIQETQNIDEFLSWNSGNGQELIITDHAKPVLKISPIKEEPKVVLKELRNSVLFYENPLEPVAENDFRVYNPDFL